MIVDVGPADEFASDAVRVVDVNGREVCVVSTGGEWFGVRNICPHQTETLARGFVKPEIKLGAQLGEFRVTDRMLIACPRHCWAFDLRTGQCVVDPNLRVRAYAVTVEDGRVLVDDGRREAPAGRGVETVEASANRAL
jgi:3-phenylpropionate/trans-cinnamate dioxygenase ferredoxin subunit